jgi:hypothetical protein
MPHPAKVRPSCAEREERRSGGARSKLPAGRGRESGRVLGSIALPGYWSLLPGDSLIPWPFSYSLSINPVAVVRASERK